MVIRLGPAVRHGDQWIKQVVDRATLTLKEEPCNDRSASAGCWAWPSSRPGSALRYRSSGPSPGSRIPPRDPGRRRPRRTRARRGSRSSASRSSSRNPRRQIAPGFPRRHRFGFEAAPRDGTSLTFALDEPQRLILGVETKDCKITRFRDDRGTDLAPDGEEPAGGGMAGVPRPGQDEGPFSAEVDPAGHRVTITVHSPRLPAGGANRLLARDGPGREVCPGREDVRAEERQPESWTSLRRARIAWS